MVLTWAASNIYIILELYLYFLLNKTHSWHFSDLQISKIEKKRKVYFQNSWSF